LIYLFIIFCVITFDFVQQMSTLMLTWWNWTARHLTVASL